MAGFRALLNSGEYDDLAYDAQPSFQKGFLFYQTRQAAQLQPGLQAANFHYPPLAQVPQPHMYHPSINPRAGVHFWVIMICVKVQGHLVLTWTVKTTVQQQAVRVLAGHRQLARCVIESVKNHYQKLTTTKSSVGKSSVWKSIFKEFEGLCAENGVDSRKTVMQYKLFTTGNIVLMESLRAISPRVTVNPR